MRLTTRLFVTVCLLVIQGCAVHHLPQQAPARATVPARQFLFNDGGNAVFFTLDKGMNASASAIHPATFVFVVSGSDCISMQDMLPQYFDGFEGGPGSMRIFILHKRFIGTSDCGSRFIEMDYPSRWADDQTEFILAQLFIARMNRQVPSKVLVLGISEGAEVVPLLARRIGDVTHAALLGNGGMNPYDALRMQAAKYGFADALREIDSICNDNPNSFREVVADRSCRYWSELRSLKHSDHLLQLDIPLFVAMGESDRMVPIESAWYIRDRFAAAGKTNLHVLAVRDADHGFRKQDGAALPLVWRTLARWLQGEISGRE